MERITLMEPYHLEAICKSIAETSTGLTGSEIHRLLQQSNILDTDPTLTKWKRLYNAFAHSQNKDRSPDNILAFLKSAMHPSRYIGQEASFQSRRHDINKCLCFIGIEITDQGNLMQVSQATTISEAEQRASKYKYKLTNRNVHANVIRYCDAELLNENYFHSVFEGVKSIADRLRQFTGLYTDGNELADLAFSTKNPLIHINSLQTDTERNEHIGLMNLIKGLFGLIRNPTAHTPKIKFNIDEEQALDIMTTVSLIHKRLDQAW